LIKVLFSQRRKTILNNLRAGASRLGLLDESRIASVLNDSLIDPQRRAETLSIEEIVRLKARIKNS
jgi:16S rRNA (adenine1518-N6/adenine1519-N6)-dimethyltransferase